MKLSQFRQLIREEVRKVVNEASTDKKGMADIGAPKDGFFQFDSEKVSKKQMMDLKKQLNALVSQGKLPKFEMRLAEKGYGMHVLDFGKQVNSAIMSSLNIWKSGQRSIPVRDDDYGEKRNVNFTAQDKKDFKRDVMDIYKNASNGEDMTDNINDELGDYFDKMKASKDTELKRAYNKLRGEIDGSVEKQAKYAKALLDLLK